MLDQFKVTYTPEAARWLCSLANIASMDTYSEAGAVRYAIKVWQMALTMFSGQQITVSMLRQANTLLRGEEWSQMADRLAAQMVREAKAVG